MNSTSSSPKKPYQRPTLRVYGNIKEVTKANLGSGLLDSGGFGSHDKTS